MARDPAIEPAYRISQLAREFGLSRSTLLYYDRIGLLRPSGRSRANYRLYSQADRERLAQVCRYRRTGMPLKTIAEVLAAPRRKTARALERRLESLNREIHDLRVRQRIIVSLLKNRSLLAGTRVLDKARWVAVLREAGMDDADMAQWHAAFERMSPEAHQDFLEYLGIDADEIDAIRSWSGSEHSI